MNLWWMWMPNNEHRCKFREFRMECRALNNEFQPQMTTMIDRSRKIVIIPSVFCFTFFKNVHSSISLPWECNWFCGMSARVKAKQKRPKNNSRVLLQFSYKFGSIWHCQRRRNEEKSIERNWSKRNNNQQEYLSINYQRNWIYWNAVIALELILFRCIYFMISRRHRVSYNLWNSEILDIGS